VQSGPAQEQKFGELGLQIVALQTGDKILSDCVQDIRAKGAHELSEFKLDASKHYATNEVIRAVEVRIVGAIDRLGNRLDRIIDG
jgi:hypothetical protein